MNIIKTRCKPLFCEPLEMALLPKVGLPIVGREALIYMNHRFSVPVPVDARSKV